MNVPFTRIYPQSNEPIEVGFETIVFFSSALSLPHEPLVSLIAHEVAHCFADERDYEDDEAAADTLAISWGFEKELAELRHH